MAFEQRYRDQIDLDRLQRAYADVVNRRAWDELDGIFAPDIVLRIDPIDRPVIEVEGPDGFRAFVEPAVTRFAFFEFVILNSHVELPTSEAPDDASARIYMCEVRRAADTHDWSTAYGLYQDRYRRGADGWRIAERSYRSLTRTDGPLHPPPSILGGPAQP
jgi:hypothetical protein